MSCVCPGVRGGLLRAVLFAESRRKMELHKFPLVRVLCRKISRYAARGAVAHFLEHEGLKVEQKSGRGTGVPGFGVDGSFPQKRRLQKIHVGGGEALVYGGEFLVAQILHGRSKGPQGVLLLPVRETAEFFQSCHVVLRGLERCKKSTGIQRARLTQNFKRFCGGSGETGLTSDNFGGGSKALKGNFVGFYIVQPDGFFLPELDLMFTEYAGLFSNSA